MTEVPGWFTRPWVSLFGGAPLALTLLFVQLLFIAMIRSLAVVPAVASEDQSRMTVPTIEKYLFFESPMNWRVGDRIVRWDHAAEPLGIGLGGWDRDKEIRTWMDVFFADAMINGLEIEVIEDLDDSEGRFIRGTGSYWPFDKANLLVDFAPVEGYLANLHLSWSDTILTSSGLGDYADASAERGCFSYAHPQVTSAGQGMPQAFSGFLDIAMIFPRESLEGSALDDCLFRGFAIALGLHLTERLAFDPQPLSEAERGEVLSILRLLYHPKVTPGMQRADFFRLLKREGLLTPHFLAQRHEAVLLHLDLDHLAAYPAPRGEREASNDSRYFSADRLPGRVIRFQRPAAGPIPLVVSEGLSGPLAAAMENLTSGLRPDGQPAFEVWRSGADLEALAEAYRPGGPAVPDRPHILVAQMAAERPDRQKLWPNYLFAKDNRDPDLSHFARLGCAAYRAPLPGGGVPLAAVVVDEALPPHEKEACLTLGLARALGLNVREGRDFPALTLEAADKVRLRLLLELLYHPAVEPGMTRSELDATLAGAGVIATPEPVR